MTKIPSGEDTQKIHILSKLEVDPTNGFRDIESHRKTLQTDIQTGGQTDS